MKPSFIFPHLSKDLILSMDWSKPAIQQDIMARLVTLRQQHHFDFSKATGRAAILMPLILNGREGQILYTLRSSGLRHHSGEVSFPGGKLDDRLDGGSLLKCVLRETFEEIGLDGNRINILGSMYDIPSKDRRLRITPFVGIITPGAADGDVHWWKRLELNADEVKSVFAVKLIDLLSTENVSMSHYIRDELQVRIPTFHCQQEDGSKLKVWGLTAYVTHCILKNVLFPSLPLPSPINK